MHYVTAPLQVDHRQYQLTYFKTNRLSLIDDLPDLGLIQEVNFVPVAWHVKKKNRKKKPVSCTTAPDLPLSAVG